VAYIQDISKANVCQHVYCTTDRLMPFPESSTWQSTARIVGDQPSALHNFRAKYREVMQRTTEGMISVYVHDVESFVGK
jgi:hypothetical protein